MEPAKMLLAVPLQNNITSSTYNICEGMLVDLFPLISFSLSFHTNIERPLLRTSSVIQKRIRDKGSPCLTPLEQAK